jgi:hypothetical protein
MVTRLAEVLLYRGEPVPDTRVVPDAEPVPAARQPEMASPESAPDTARRSLLDRLRRGK